ncbi:MAG TPA: peptidoglycan-binding domain-containing protein [Hyphomicrobium sp.]|nr:peptidoglycan-binding domain-containing protein [Hyphomicrobium sp.]
MQRFGGLLLMLIGTVALGGYLYLPSSEDDAAELAEVMRISVAPSHPIHPDGTVRVFAPASPIFRDAVKRNDTASSDRPAAATAWTTVVTPSHSRRAVLRSSQPGDAPTRYELARDLQRGLKRAGCYGGAITGVWSPSTKRAMSAFLERANATLPIEAPDFILLSLVQSHNEIVCSDACPSGQMMDRAGRCMPNAIVAQTDKRSDSPDATTKATRRARVVVGSAEQLPWLDRNGRSLVTPSHRSAPLPGMMSMGGPPVAPEPAAAGNGASSGTGSHISVEPDSDTPLIPPAGSVADPNGSRVASLTAEDGTAGDAAAIAAVAEPDLLTIAKPEKRRHAKRARNWDRPKHERRYAGRRRGEPRPGTMRYNLVQALGGIY